MVHCLGKMCTLDEVWAWYLDGKICTQGEAWAWYIAWGRGGMCTLDEVWAWYIAWGRCVHWTRFGHGTLMGRYVHKLRLGYGTLLGGGGDMYTSLGLGMVP